MPRRWFSVRVAGESMLPTLSPGDILAVRAPRDGEPRPGQIVVWRTSERESVKRVSEPPPGLEPDAIWLMGDNRAFSTDSRSVGPVPRADVVGIARARVRPLGRARLFR